jgi:hypothetical protein
VGDVQGLAEEAAGGIHDQSPAGGGRHVGQRFHRVQQAGRRLVVHHRDVADLRMLAQPAGDVRRAHRRGEVVAQCLRGDPRRTADAQHPVAVHAVVDHEDRAFRRHQEVRAASTAAVPEPVKSTALNVRSMPSTPTRR